MAAKDFERDCRYGHGKLNQAEGTWMLQAAPHDPPGPENLPMEIRRQFTFGVQLHVCPVCGYTEFTDA
jgi:hypothetical protein